MLKVDCDICGNELNEPGALLIGIPDENNKCSKTHICVNCDKLLSAIIEGLKIKIALKRK